MKVEKIYGDLPILETELLILRKVTLEDLEDMHLYGSDEEVSKYNSGIQINRLTKIRVWTDVVRESRNAIHFGAVPTTPNTFEKASTLLLAAFKNLQTLYKLKFESDK